MCHAVVDFIIRIFKNPAFITVFSGGMAGALVTLAYNTRKTKREYRALVLGFSTEFVLLYERCVIYYRQFNEGAVSFSTLFSFLTSDGYLKIISACGDPEIIKAIIELKASYFQISRHVLSASDYAAESSRASDDGEAKVLMTKARHAQGTAIAFFTGESYKRILDNTKVILDEAKKVAKGQMISNLEEKFEKSQKLKEEIEIPSK